MLIIIKTKDNCSLNSSKEGIENIIKNIEDVRVFDEDEIVISKKIPVFTCEGIAKIYAKEKEDGRNN